MGIDWTDCVIGLGELLKFRNDGFSGQGLLGKLSGKSIFQIAL